MYKLELAVSISVVKQLGLKDGVYRYCLRPDFKERLKEMKEANIDRIEIDVSQTWYADVALNILKQALKIMKREGIKLNSVHFPFGRTWIDMAYAYEPDRQEIVKWIGKVFKIVDNYEPKAYVFHPGGIDLTENGKDAAFEALVKSANEMSKLTKVPVCFENMVSGYLTQSIDRLVELVTKAPDANIVVDVNHFLHNGEKAEDAILKLKDKVKALHISDYDFVKERHLMPGKGLINWNNVIGALEKVGYNGSFTYEVAARHGHTYKEIRENYEKLFEDYNKSK